MAAGLRQDEAAVRAALTTPWSNGPVEGQVNRLKVIKRQMYGRAGLPFAEGASGQRGLSEQPGWHRARGKDRFAPSLRENPFLMPITRQLDFPIRSDLLPRQRQLDFPIR